MTKRVLTLPRRSLRNGLLRIHDDEPMRALLLTILAVGLVTGCGSAPTTAPTAGTTAPAATGVTGPEQAYLDEIAGSAPQARQSLTNSALTTFGYAACTSLNEESANPAAAVTTVTGPGVDDVLARVIVRAASDYLCPAHRGVDVGSSTAAPPVQQLNDLGKTVVNGGIAITLKAARTTDTIQMNQSNYRQGSGNERYTRTPAGAGAKYVVVETHVDNREKSSIDLTCSLPVKTVLIDAQQRNFDPIDDLYKIKGNPECNANLQPGFGDDMTWVYRVPADATVLGFGFQDITDPSTPTEDWTTAHLQV